MRIITILSLFTFLATSVSQAQISDYYNDAIDLSDDELKTALHNIIDGHQQFPYSSGGTDTWDILKQTDRDPDNSQNVILIYTGNSVNGAQEFNGGSGWNREHVWPQSRGNFGTSPGPGTDTHCLRPSNIQVNADRGSKFFANCVNCTPVINQGQETGNFIDEPNSSFEPRDAIKGDIARMLFYMAVRYEGGSGPDLELIDNILVEGNNPPLMGVVSDLLEWNEEDPVDDFEINRNEVVFGYQGNRNPFVDHPELAEHIWGDLMGETWPFTMSTFTETPRVFNVYPNPTDGNITISGKWESAWVFDVTGQQVAAFSDGSETDLEGFSKGMYTLIILGSSGEKEVTRIVKQ
ncbi:MAG: endonuclease [Cryomorphaceae bacterium]|nr:endonuclease [Flavobacteriales bacterium]